MSTAIRSRKRSIMRAMVHLVRINPWPFLHAWDAYVCEHVDPDDLYAGY